MPPRPVFTWKAVTILNSMQKCGLVTGAGSGVGEATACALVRAGYFIVLTGRRVDRLRDVQSKCDPDKTTTLVVEADVSDPLSVRALFEQAKARSPRLDLLFNNAGTNIPAVPLEEVTYEQWRQVIDTNLTGTFLCTQEAIRWMKSQTPCGGRIINNGSVSAQVPRPQSSAYTASKHAITGLTKSIALDGRAHNIACGQVDIGNAETEMASRTKSGVLQATGKVAAEPMMDVNHVANAVVHMASLPLEANILFLTVMATNMPLVGRG